MTEVKSTDSLPKPSRLTKIVFAVCALALLTAASLHLVWMDRGLAIDEIGLHNPVYMLLHTGKMTYPVHSRPYGMIVHPPVVYGSVAFLMYCGLSLFHAAGVLAVLIFAILAAVLFFSRIPMLLQFSLLIGTFLTVFRWMPPFTLRPEIPASLAFVGGLGALEAGRLADWNSRFLFVGSMLLAYASIAHYVNYPASAGLIVYLVWAWIRAPRTAALRRSSALVLGAAVLWLPYLAMNVIPNLHEISGLMGDTQNKWNLLSGLRVHRQCYDYWWRSFQYYWTHDPMSATLLAPIWKWRIPAVFIGAPLLFLFRSTRGIAMACLPLLLFMLFGVSRKQVNSPGYFLPEFAIYCSGALAVILTLAMKLAGLVRIPLQACLCAGMALLTVGTLYADRSVFDGKNLVADLDELDLSRAASQLIVGRDAFVGGDILPWYTSGARDYFPITPVLLWRPDIKNLNRRAFFSQFDALALEPFQSYLTANEQRESLTSSFIEGLLHLRGFYFADRRSGVSSELSLLFLNSNPIRGGLTGIAVSKREVYRFDEDPAGNFVFYCGVCPITDLQNGAGRFEYFSTDYVPLATNADPESRSDCGNSTPVIRSLMVSKDAFQSQVRGEASHCSTQAIVTGRLSHLNREQLVHELRAQDQPMRFYMDLNVAAVGRGKVNSLNTKTVDGALDLNTLVVGHPGAKVERTNGGVRVTTSSDRYYYEAAAQVKVPPGVVRGYLHVRGRVLKGAVEVGLLRSKTNFFPGEQIWDSRDDISEVYVPVYNLEGVDMFIVRNVRDGGPSQILIQDAAIVTSSEMPAAGPFNGGDEYPARPLCSVPPVDATGRRSR